MIFAAERFFQDISTVLLPMAGFAFATSASPGPVNIVSAMSGARFGVLRTLPYVLGATFGFIAILLLVGLGLGTFVTRHPLLVKLLATAGASYMLLLAYRIAQAPSSPVRQGDAAAASPRLMAGVIAQFINPKAWIVSMSAISIYVATSASYAAALAVLCLIFLVICALSLSTWSLLGAAFSRHPGALRGFNLAMAALLTLSIVLFLLETLFSLSPAA